MKMKNTSCSGILKRLESEKDLINSKRLDCLRLGSVYGQNDDSTRLNIMPNLFSKILSENGTIKLYSGGTHLSIVSVKMLRDVSSLWRK